MKPKYNKEIRPASFGGLATIQVRTGSREAIAEVDSYASKEF